MTCIKTRIPDMVATALAIKLPKYRFYNDLLACEDGAAVVRLSYKDRDIGKGLRIEIDDKTLNLYYTHHLDKKLNHEQWIFECDFIYENLILCEFLQRCFSSKNIKLIRKQIAACDVIAFNKMYNLGEFVVNHVPINQQAA